MSATHTNRKLIGVLVPYFNSVVEPELADLRPPAVSNQTARFTLDANVVQDLEDAARKLLSCGPHALIVGLATESFPDGLALARQVADGLQTIAGVPVVTASHATHAALRALETRRIAVVTPFDADANALVRAAFESEGFTVLGMHGLACADLAAIGRIPAGEVGRAFAAADHPEAQALVQVGTGLPVLHLVDELERTHAKPVVACNPAAYWQALRAVGVTDRHRGFGRLLATR